MKVLWFTNTPSLAATRLGLPAIGGGWIESLEERIRQEKNIDLAIAFAHGKDQPDKFSENGVTYYTIPDRRSKIKRFVSRHLNTSDDQALIDDCLKIMADFKPDIVNVFGTEKGFGLIAGKTGIPVVIHLQGILTVYEKKWFSPGIGKGTLLYHSGIRKLLRGGSLIHSYYYYRRAARREERIFKKGRFFMGRTDWDRRIVSVLAPGARYYTCNEMIKKEFYANEWNKVPQGTKTFVSTIQANIYKGLETVLECAALLTALNRFPFTWIIVGISGTDPLVRLFERRIGKKFHAVNVVFSGSLPAADLIKRQLDADIFLHPSHIDNSPNSVCEAMLLGMPVIATNTGGTPSLLTDKKEGLLIQDGDPYAMAGAILELIDDPSHAAGLGQQARIRARKRHDPDEIVHNLIDIYSQIVKEPV